MRNRWILIGASLGVLWHGMAMGQVTVDNAGSVGQYTSLTVVNGNPAISYFDDDNDDLKYVRATDVDGSAWAVPVMVDGALENVGYYTSLSVVNGNPAISYWDVSNGDLKYVRATDANGSAWGAPVTADSGDYIGGWTSLTVVNGNPAISYFYGSTADLKYVQATDVNGSAWAVPLSVDSAEAVGEYTSLAVVNGNPAISYYDFTNSGLKYVRATDVNGSAWAVPLAVDSAEAVGEYTSLAVVNGNPAVSYYDSTNGDLKYWRGSSEINLKQGVTDIADGGTYNFGSQNLGTNTNVTFTIENTGSLNLTITTPVAIGGADAGQFSVQQQPVSPVAPSGTTTFIIRFSPTSLGAKTASISIANNDGDENPYDLTIQGAGGNVPATSIPAMNEWGMIILFLLITGMALWGILRKKAEC